MLKWSSRWDRRGGERTDIEGMHADGGSGAKVREEACGEGRRWSQASELTN